MEFNKNLYLILKNSIENTNSVQKQLVLKEVDEFNISNKRASNAISVGLLGTGIFLSFNYDKILLQKENYFVNGGIGFGYHVIGVNFSHNVSFNYGKKKHFEIGIGRTYLKSNFFSESTIYHVYPLLGYRFQKPDGGFLFRIYVNPLYNPKIQYGNKILPWGGLGFGYCF